MQSVHAFEKVAYWSEQVKAPDLPFKPAMQPTAKDIVELKVAYDSKEPVPSGPISLIPYNTTKMLQFLNAFRRLHPDRMYDDYEPLTKTSHLDYAYVDGLLTPDEAARAYHHFEVDYSNAVSRFTGGLVIDAEKPNGHIGNRYRTLGTTTRVGTFVEEYPKIHSVGCGPLPCLEFVVSETMAGEVAVPQLTTALYLGILARNGPYETIDDKAVEFYGMRAIGVMANSTPAPLGFITVMACHTRHDSPRVPEQFKQDRLDRVFARSIIEIM